ncbi:hypothetical protein F5Y18DRAFT_424519 [Xylariaceae sp. FL1019]|nr:hypothetical protein F5Y18DRAFT_424519 [Xylariaceae sp. FL1019]
MDYLVDLGRYAAGVVVQHIHSDPKEWLEVYEHGKRRKVKYSEIVKDHLDEWYPYLSVIFGDDFLSKGTEEIPVPLARNPYAERVPLRIIKLGTWDDVRDRDDLWDSMAQELGADIRSAMLYPHSSQAFHYIFVHSMWRHVPAETQKVLLFEEVLAEIFKGGDPFSLPGRVVFFSQSDVTLGPAAPSPWNRGVWQQLVTLRPSGYYFCKHRLVRVPVSPEDTLTDDPPPPYSESPGIDSEPT